MIKFFDKNQAKLDFFLFTVISCIVFYWKIPNKIIPGCLISLETQLFGILYHIMQCTMLNLIIKTGLFTHAHAYYCLNAKIYFQFEAHLN